MDINKNSLLHWLKKVTFEVDLNFLKKNPLRGKYISNHKGITNLAQYLFAGEVHDDYAILNNIYFDKVDLEKSEFIVSNNLTSSDIFFKITGLTKPSFFNELYFGDLFTEYEYKVIYDNLRDNCFQMEKTRKQDYWLIDPNTVCYNPDSYNSSMYGRSGLGMCKEKSEWSTYFSDGFYYALLLEDYYNRPKFLTVIIKDFYEVFLPKWYLIYLVVYFLAFFIISRFTDSVTAYLFAGCVTIVYVSTFHYLFFIKRTKVKEHLELIDKHDKLVEEGMNIIFQSQP